MVTEGRLELIPRAVVLLGFRGLMGHADEDMTPMQTTMFGAWYGGVGGQQGCPSQEVGPRLIWFESPRWRPSPTEVGAHLGFQY